MENCKICKNCNIEKELTEFRKNNAYKDGLSSWCKLCHNKAALAYNKAHPQLSNKWNKAEKGRSGIWIREHRDLWREYQNVRYNAIKEGTWVFKKDK